MLPEYKLLQLQPCLTGEALQVVKYLGHPAAAYDAAKCRLNRRFGEDRCRFARFYEHIEKAKPVRPENSEELELFADFLDIVKINLKDAGQIDELKAGPLCLQVQKKSCPRPY